MAAVFVWEGRILARRRPVNGLWSGLWEVPTAERGNGRSEREVLAELARCEGVILRGRSRRVGVVQHELTHRSMTFEVFVAAALPSRPVSRDGRTGGPAAGDTPPTGAADADGLPRRWVTPGAFPKLGVSTAQRRIVALADGGLPRAEAADHRAAS